jgi:hypothetical protein
MYFAEIEIANDRNITVKKSEEGAGLVYLESWPCPWTLHIVERLRGHSTTYLDRVPLWNVGVATILLSGNSSIYVGHYILLY